MEVTASDGSYSLKEMIDLMKRVQLDSADSSRPWGSFGRSSCTARFQRSHKVFSGGLVRDVVSLFIPYGNLIFASFQTAKIMLRQDYDAQNLGAIIPGTSNRWSQLTSNVTVGNGATYHNGLEPQVSSEWSQIWSPPQRSGLDITFLGHQSYVAQGNAAQDNSAMASGSAGINPTAAYGSNFGRQSDTPSYVNLQQLDRHQSRAPKSEQYSYSASPSTSTPPINRPIFDRNRNQHTQLASLLRPHNKSPDQDRVTFGNNRTIVTHPETPHHKRKPSYDPPHSQSFRPDELSASRMPPQDPAHFERDDPEWSSRRPSNAATDYCATPEHSNAGHSARQFVPPPQGVDRCVDCGRTESPEWRKSERGLKEMCNA